MYEVVKQLNYGKESFCILKCGEPVRDKRGEMIRFLSENSAMDHVEKIMEGDE